MPDIVGVRFKRAGKVYYFDPASTDLKVYDYVVVQTARGVELGQVTIAPKQVLAAEITAELKPIVRKATEEDIKRAQDYAAKEEYALAECGKIIQKLNLPMKLVIAEYNLDGSRLTFYFTADERVDFRELVRELTAFFKSRIELRQIGPRDQAKMIGGMGRCGRMLCCSSYLTEFNPVSIKMAKEQDLPLDPMKISGVCGRLQCCLAYESSMYHDIKAQMPKRGQRVSTPSGNGWVTGIYPLKESVMVDLESQTSAEFPFSQVKVLEEQVSVQSQKSAAVQLEETASEQKTAMNTTPHPSSLNQPEKPAQVTTQTPAVVQPAGGLEIKPDSLPPAVIEPKQNQETREKPPTQFQPQAPKQEDKHQP
jgi:cell fate regulator YaaT (PSP1 superfamily)